MNFPRLIYLLLSACLFSPGSNAQDFSATVLPIHDVHLAVPGLQLEFGTGFCLNTPCTEVVTTYHFEAMAHPRAIAHVKIIQRFLATGPADDGAAPMRVAGSFSIALNASRDLAIYKLKTRLPARHGASFSLDELQLGQDVDIYAYPSENKLKLRKLLRFSGRFTGVSGRGLLAFDYEPFDGHRIRPGASGGIVVDHKSQQIVGVLNAMAEDGSPTAFAVPIQSLVDCVSKAEPETAQAVFSPPLTFVSTTLPDLYPKLEINRPAGLSFRSNESPAVQFLRHQAQALADSMENFIALQSVEWGSGNKRAAASADYEIRVLDGVQKFREYPHGKKLLRDLPFPPLNTAIVTGDEWAELPRMVAEEPRLRVEQMPDNSVGGQFIKVFRYRGDAEDGVCRWRSSVDWGFFTVNKDLTISCYGEVWTDKDTNILRMSEHYELACAWQNYQAVMTYGWLTRPGESARLIPTSISSRAEHHGKTYWCRSQFSHYQVFSSEVRMTMK